MLSLLFNTKFLLILLIIANVFFFLFYYITKKHFKIDWLQRLSKFCFFSFLIISVLELTVFNFRSYQSLFYKEIIPNNYTLGPGLELQENGTIKQVKDKENYIEFTNIHEHLNNIYISLNTNTESNRILKVTIGYTDRANKKYSFTQERNMHGESSGEIVHLQLSGKTSKMKVYVKTLDPESDTFSIQKISFNKPVDFKISIIRDALIFCFCLLIFIFRPKSIIYKYSFSDKKAKIFIVLAVVLQCLLLCVVSQMMPFFGREQFDVPQRRQYQLLTESILKGKPYLEIEPGPVLKSLSNPYDKKYRAAKLAETGEKYIWDAAYYKGKYYVYFGVAPVILYYLPFYAVTGHHLKTVVPILITAILATIGIFLLFKKVCSKWFKNISAGHYIMLSVITACGCGMLAICGRPDHYSLPIIMGIAFTIWGLIFYLKAAEKEKLSKRYLLLGSLCMALIAACRPQMLLSSFFAIPIFIDHIKKREFISKKSIKETLCFLIPFIVVAIALMYYNYIRFGSPFDFGANYNLTTNDMTKRGFVLERIPLGIFYYLFKPVNIIPKFPFIIRETVMTNYMGTTIFEPMAGGFLMINLIAFFGMFIFHFKNNFKDKLPYKLGVLSIVFALIIIAADTQMAGILPRYFADFGIYLYLATALVIFSILNNKERDKHFDTILIVLFILAFTCNFINLLNDPTFLKSRVFFYLRKVIEFWV